MQLKPKQSSTTDSFISLLDRYAAYVVKAEKKVYRSSPAEAERLFQALDESKKANLISRLEADLSLFEDVVRAGDPLSDARRLIWRFMAKHGHTPCSDLFDKIDATDVVEVYGVDSIHLCQNFNFFEWVSVSLERIFCQAWHETTERDPHFVERAHAIIGGVLSGQHRETYRPDFNWHWVQEIGSEMLYRFQLRTKWISPLYLDQKLAGFVLVNECRALESMVKSQPEEKQTRVDAPRKLALVSKTEVDQDE